MNIFHILFKLSLSQHVPLWVTRRSLYERYLQLFQGVQAEQPSFGDLSDNVVVKLTEKEKISHDKYNYLKK